MQQRIAHHCTNARLGNGNRQPEDPGNVDTGTNIHPAGKLFAADKPNARQQRDDRGDQPRPGRPYTVPALGHPQSEHYRQQPRQALLITAHRRQWLKFARRMRFAREQPADKHNQRCTLQPTQHRCVQQQIREIIQMNAVSPFRCPAHHQIGHVGGQNGGGKLEGAKTHRQCQPIPSAGTVLNARAFRHCRHNRHQQRNTPHVRGHHERQCIAQ